MTDNIRAYLTDALALEFRDDPLSPCEITATFASHLADVLLRLPGIAIVDRETLAKAIASGIRSYGGGEADGYSYHGDRSALEAMHRLDRDADNIAQYIFTHESLANKERE